MVVSKILERHLFDRNLNFMVLSISSKDYIFLTLQKQTLSFK